MGRRSDHSRDELASLVVQAATSIVAADGKTSVTMRGVAAAIGYTAGSIYNAVGDIDAVLLRVGAATLERLGEDLEGALEASGRTAADMDRALLVAETYVVFVTANQRLWTALLERPPAPGSDVPDWYAQPRAQLVEIVARVLAPFYPETQARRRAVITLWAALQGIASLTTGGNLAFMADDADVRDIARSVVLRYLTGQEQ